MRGFFVLSDRNGPCHCSAAMMHDALITAFKIYIQLLHDVYPVRTTSTVQFAPV